MKELEKILEEIRVKAIELKNTYWADDERHLTGKGVEAMCVQVEQVIRKHMNDGWIPVEKALPRCEEEVFIQTERGTRTTAMYEDGTMREEDSIWHWCDIDGDWDEEKDCMIIPKGWWEYRHFNPDDVYNNVVDEKVIAWRPLPDLYQLEIES